MLLIRIEWMTLAIATAAFAVFSALERMWWATECQLGLLPTTLIRDWDECTESTFSFYGAGLLVPLAIPVVLCVIPGVVPRRGVASVSAAALAAFCISTFWLAPYPLPGSGAALLGFAGYCWPSAIMAILLASLHDRLAATLHN
ncbi:hypothetical protein [Rhodococcus sp. OK519]|uniref:hypothetical protein n=1 Tax=Rhodococcus sp. OK519 TaxID=2135729 RepID=UPI000D3A56AF